MMTNKEMDAIWSCPRCGAKANKCGKGGREACKYLEGVEGDCNGFLCECDVDGELHGMTLLDQCQEANCYHCGWGGQFPLSNELKGWQKKAWDAGWRPTA